MAEQRMELEDESGFLFELHDLLREITTTFNDTTKGTCAVCMESLCSEAEQDANNFSDRVDLIRID